MGCNCGRKRTEAVTSANVATTAPDRPDIAAAKAAAVARVNAARNGEDNTTK